MKITRRQLRKIIQEACGLESPAEDQMVMGVEAPADHYSADVPVPEDYDKTRDFLEQNADIVDLGLSMVMGMAGTGCERSTAQGIIDHLQAMLDGGPVADAGVEAVVDPMHGAIDPLLALQGALQ
jgi:hypothetical protein